MSQHPLPPADEGQEALTILWHWAPLVVVIGVVIGGLWLADRVLLRGRSLSLDRRVPRQIAMLVMSVFGVVMVVLAAPSEAHGGLSESTRGSLLSLIGLGVTAVLTLSSTTLAANAMAGLMLRATARFRGGDWVRVGDHFGRVTERGLFHTEIQTEDKDLMSLPNLYLATKPVRIVQSAGTIVSAEVSIGYDARHDVVERLLLKAAASTGLIEPFVWLTDLKDHAVVYRVAGTLEEVKGLISVRSRLRAQVLDTLHAEGLEVASPALMIQRRGELGDVAVPAEPRRGGEAHRSPAHDGDVEARLFDKAEEAAKQSDLDEEIEKLKSRAEEIRGKLKDAEDGATDALRAEEEEIAARLESLRAERETEGEVGPDSDG